MSGRVRKGGERLMATHLRAKDADAAGALDKSRLAGSKRLLVSESSRLPRRSAPVDQGQRPSSRDLQGVPRRRRSAGKRSCLLMAEMGRGPDEAVVLEDAVLCEHALGLGAERRRNVGGVVLAGELRLREVGLRERGEPCQHRRIQTRLEEQTYDDPVADLPLGHVLADSDDLAGAVRGWDELQKRAGQMASSAQGDILISKQTSTHIRRHLSRVEALGGLE